MSRHFLIIWFDKMFSIKSLSLFGTESEIERMTKFEKFDLQPNSLKPTKSKVRVAYGKNSMSDLASNNDTAINYVNGRTDNKIWCKCEWCALMKTSIEGICSLENPEICKPRFSNKSCLNVCRSDPHFVPWYSWRENLVSYLIST